jgi:hypothetical protein
LRPPYAGSPECRAQRVFFAIHHRYRPGDYETWKYVAPVQRAAWQHKTFEYGTWGGESRTEFVPAPGEIVAQEHWCSSGFANTDLDLQLKKHGIHQLIVIGLIAHTCIEATSPLCRRTWLRGHGGQRRDSGLIAMNDAQRYRYRQPNDADEIIAISHSPSRRLGCRQPAIRIP